MTWEYLGEQPALPGHAFFDPDSAFIDLAALERNVLMTLYCIYSCKDPFYLLYSEMSQLFSRGSRLYRDFVPRTSLTACLPKAQTLVSTKILLFVGARSGSRTCPSTAIPADDAPRATPACAPLLPDENYSPTVQDGTMSDERRSLDDCVFTVTPAQEDVNKTTNNYNSKSRCVYHPPN